MPTNDHIHEYIRDLRTKNPHTEEAVNNVYELQIIETTIQYLHTAAGLPVKST